MSQSFLQNQEGQNDDVVIVAFISINVNGYNALFAYRQINGFEYFITLKTAGNPDLGLKKDESK